MAILGYILMGIGGLFAIISGILILMAAFQESVLWGIGCIVVPLVSLLFVLNHWEETKRPFFGQILGVGLFILGGVLTGGSQH